MNKLNIFENINTKLKNDNTLSNIKQTSENDHVKNKGIIKELDEHIENNKKNLQEHNEEIEQINTKLVYLNLESERLTFLLTQEKTNKNEETYEYKQFISNQIRENTKNNAKIAIAKYYQQKYKELKEKNLKKTKKLDVESVCVMHIIGNRDGDDEESTRYNVHIFSILNETKLKEIFEKACIFWGISDKKSYVLTDSEHNDLSLLYEYSVENFFRESDYPAANLLLQEKNLKLTVLNQSQVDSIKNNKIGEIGTTGGKKNNNEIKNLFDIILEKKPGLKDYVPKGKQPKPQEKKYVKLTFMLVYVILLILMLITLIKSAFIQDFVTIRSRLMDLLTGIEYESIRTNQNLFKYIGEKWHFYNDEGKPNNPTILNIGDIRFLQMRIKTKECSNFDKISSNMALMDAIDYFKGTCSYSDYDDNSKQSDTIKTEEVGTSKQNITWKKYKNAKDSGNLPIQGKLSYYDGSGYIQDYDSNLKKSDFIQEMKYLENNDYLIEETKAIAIQGNFFELNRKYFVTITQLFEFSFEIKYVPSTIIDIYLVRHTDIEEFSYLQKIDITILVLFIVVFIFSIILNGRKITEDEQKIDYSYFWSLSFVVELTILILICVYYGIFYRNPEGSFTDFLQRTGYNNLLSYKYDYQDALRIKSILIFFVAAKLLFSFTASKTIYLFGLILQKSYKSMVMVLVLIFTVYSAFSIITWIDFGQELSNFNTYRKSFPALFYVYNTADKFLRIFMFFTKTTEFIVFSIFIVLILIYLFNSLILSVIFESYRLLQLSEDYDKTVGIYEILQDLWRWILKKIKK